MAINKGEAEEKAVESQSCQTGGYRLNQVHHSC